MASTRKYPIRSLSPLTWKTNGPSCIAAYLRNRKSMKQRPLMVHTIGGAPPSEATALDYAEPVRRQLTHCELSDGGETLLTLDTMIHGGGPAAFALRLHSIEQRPSMCSTLLATIEEERSVAMSACLLNRNLAAVAGPTRRGALPAQGQCVRVFKYGDGQLQEIWKIDSDTHVINVSHFMQCRPPILITNEAVCVANHTETTWAESKVSMWDAETGAHLRDFGYANKVSTATAAVTKNGGQLDVLVVEHERTTGPHGASNAMVTLQSDAIEGAGGVSARNIPMMNL